MPVLKLVAPARATSSAPTAIPHPHITVDGIDITLDVAIANASFDDLLTRCHRWSISVQKYPQAFGKLGEDDITSLLVSTLNVVFDTAQREVFSGRGKSDIFVEHTLGDRSRAAYIGEAKIWSRPSAVKSHIDQLFRYTVDQLRQVLLIYYVKNPTIDLIRQNAISAVERLPNFSKWKQEPPHPIAEFYHPTMGHKVDVAILFVHLDFSAAVPKAKGRVSPT
jgi:hypothetical protein